jgi:transposase
LPRTQGRKPAFRGANLQQLNDFVEKNPDATLEEIKEYFSDSVHCSIVAIHNTLKRLGWRYKKNRYEPVNKTEKI